MAMQKYSTWNISLLENPDLVNKKRVRGRLPYSRIFGPSVFLLGAPSRDSRDAARLFVACWVASKRRPHRSASPPTRPDRSRNSHTDDEDDGGHGLGFSNNTDSEGEEKQPCPSRSCPHAHLASTVGGECVVGSKGVSWMEVVAESTTAQDVRDLGKPVLHARGWFSALPSWD